MELTDVSERIYEILKNPLDLDESMTKHSKFNNGNNEKAKTSINTFTPQHGRTGSTSQFGSASNTTTNQNSGGFKVFKRNKSHHFDKDTGMSRETFDNFGNPIINKNTSSSSSFNNYLMQNTLQEGAQNQLPPSLNTSSNNQNQYNIHMNQQPQHLGVLQQGNQFQQGLNNNNNLQIPQQLDSGYRQSFSPSPININQFESNNMNQNQFLLDEDNDLNNNDPLLLSSDKTKKSKTKLSLIDFMISQSNEQKNAQQKQQNSNFYNMISNPSINSGNDFPSENLNFNNNNNNRKRLSEHFVQQSPQSGINRQFPFNINTNINNQINNSHRASVGNGNNHLVLNDGSKSNAIENNSKPYQLAMPKNPNWLQSAGDDNIMISGDFGGNYGSFNNTVSPKMLNKLNNLHQTPVPYKDLETIKNSSLGGVNGQRFLSNNNNNNGNVGYGNLIQKENDENYNQNHVPYLNIRKESSSQLQNLLLSPHRLNQKNERGPLDNHNTKNAQINNIYNSNYTKILNEMNVMDTQNQKGVNIIMLIQLLDQRFESIELKIENNQNLVSLSDNLVRLKSQEVIRSKQNDQKLINQLTGQIQFLEGQVNQLEDSIGKMRNDVQRKINEYRGNVERYMEKFVKNSLELSEKIDQIGFHNNDRGSQIEQVVKEEEYEIINRRVSTINDDLNYQIKALAENISDFSKNFGDQKKLIEDNKSFIKSLEDDFYQLMSNYQDIADSMSSYKWLSEELNFLQNRQLQTLNIIKKLWDEYYSQRNSQNQFDIKKFQ